jgi:hypothetical protein
MIVYWIYLLQEVKLWMLKKLINLRDFFYKNLLINYQVQELICLVKINKKYTKFMIQLEED